MAKIRKYKLKPLFASWTIYPVMAFLFLYIVLEVMTFTENNSLTKYSQLYKSLYLASFVILIIKYRQYLPGLIGTMSVILGSILNNIVMAANGGKMPVYPSLSLVTGHIKPESFNNFDKVHVLAAGDVKLKFLADIFDASCSSSFSFIAVLIFAFTSSEGFLSYSPINLTKQEVPRL